MGGGKLIVIEGTDGSGKDTLTRRIYTRMKESGHRATTLGFPTYGSVSCAPVEAYLNGKFGTAEETGAYFPAMLFAYNRKIEMTPLIKALADGTHVILNRYVGSNIGHQGGKIDDPKLRAEFVAWTLDLEHRIFGLPRPDCTIFLHLPPAVGQQFLSFKDVGTRAYIELPTQRDIHEEDERHLTAAEHAYLETARAENWHVINCLRPGITRGIVENLGIDPYRKARPLEELEEEIWRIVEPLLREGPR